MSQLESEKSLGNEQPLFTTEEELLAALNNSETFSLAKAQILSSIENRLQKLGIVPFRIDEDEIERLSQLSFEEIDRELGLPFDEEEFGFVDSPLNFSPQDWESY